MIYMMMIIMESASRNRHGRQEHFMCASLAKKLKKLRKLRARETNVTKQTLMSANGQLSNDVKPGGYLSRHTTTRPIQGMKESKQVHHR